MLDQKKFGGWPSQKCYPVMRLTIEPQDLSKKFGIKFVQGRDELDYFLAGHFFDEDIGFVVLIRYQNAPQPGTPVYVDSQVDLSYAIERITNVLGLTPEQINWTRELSKNT